MNAISYATKKIITNIPAQILMKVFNPHPQYGIGLLASREEIIADEVIRKLVIPDMDVVGGEQRVIKISGLSAVTKAGAQIVRIPLTATGGRVITSALSIEYGAFNEAVSNSMISAVTGPTATGTSSVELVGPNVVAIKDMLASTNTHLRCVISNDRELSNIPTTAFAAFAKLCVLAAKGICYNNLIITLGESGTNGGNTNSATQAIVDSYADSMGLYEEQVETKWRKIAKSSDAVTKQRLIQMGII